MSRVDACISRRALFDLIWSKPMTTIARDFATSDAHVRALAKRLELPLPRSGHWMKAEAGKRPPTPNYLDHPTLEHETHFITAPTKRAYQGPPVPCRSAEATPIKTASDDTDEEEAVVENGATVEAQKQVATTRKALLKAEPDRRINIGGSGKFRLLVSSCGAVRAASFLDGFVVAVVKRGWKIVDTETGLTIETDGETIGFMIEEQLKPEPHTPTQAELKAEAIYIRDCALADRGIGYRPWRKPIIPTHDHVPNGNLTLKLDDNYAYRSQRRTFSDGKRQRLEPMLELIVDAFGKCAAAMKVTRAEGERRRLESEEAERRRRQRENEVRVEGYRITFLQRQIERSLQINELTTLISAWESTGSEDEAFIEMLTFARQYRERLAEQIEPAAIAQRVRQQRLLSDDVYIYDAKSIS